MIYSYAISLCLLKRGASLLTALSLFSILSCSGKTLLPEGKIFPPSKEVHREAPAIRVLIKRDLKKLTIGPGNYVIKTKRGEVVSRGEESISVDSAGGQLVWGEGELSKELMLTSRVPVSVDGTIYSGRVILYGSGRGIDIIDLIDLERYVASVLRAEVPSSFSFEAKKAMAVAIRTYGIYKMEIGEHRYYHIDNTNLSQVYAGIDNMDEEFLKAAGETRGYVVTYQGLPALTVYHSTCGGRTENSADVWKRDIPYLRATACTYCVDSPSYRWALKIHKRDFVELLHREDVEGKELISINAGLVTNMGRVKTLLVTTEKGAWKLDSSRLRALIGYAKMKSLHFRVRMAKGVVMFSGRGYGHGVGLCQFGADGLADRGYSYEKILHYYYGTEIKVRNYY